MTKDIELLRVSDERLAEDAFHAGGREIGGPFWSELNPTERWRLVRMYQAGRRSTDMESERPAPAAQVGGGEPFGWWMSDGASEARMSFEKDAQKRHARASLDWRGNWTETPLFTLSAIPTETGKGEDGDAGEWSDGGKSWEPSKVAGAGDGPLALPSPSIEEGEPVADRANDVVDALFTDLRDRRFLKWLFKEEEGVIGDFPALRSIDLAVQQEIRDEWAKIVAAALSSKEA